MLVTKINISQKYLDNLLDTITTDFEGRKTSALNNLEESVQSLCNDVNTALSI